MTDIWISYTCSVREAEVPRAEACLEAAGAQAVTCAAAGERALIVDELDGAYPLWPVCDVSGLFETSANFAELERLFSAAAIIPLHARTENLLDQDWQHTWRDQFTPQIFGERICICPSWCDAPDPCEIIINLDPGMAFGTGNHATTSMCLEWLARSDSIANARVLDYGCGSGILALAAAKLGARAVRAVDIDADALQVCRDNAHANGLAEIEITGVHAVAGEIYDIILANILLEPLLGLSEHFAELLSPHGTIVLSGILVDQVDRLLAGYAGTFKMIHQQHLGDWALVAGAKIASRTTPVQRQ
jgi:ribosomal protein L11 methyltransferase